MKKSKAFLDPLAGGDRREKEQLRIFSTLGIKLPRTKKERYKLERMARQTKRER